MASVFMPNRGRNAGAFCVGSSGGINARGAARRSIASTLGGERSKRNAGREPGGQTMSSGAWLRALEQLL